VVCINTPINGANELVTLIYLLEVLKPAPIYSLIYPCKHLNHPYISMTYDLVRFRGLQGFLYHVKVCLKFGTDVATCLHQESPDSSGSPNCGYWSRLASQYIWLVVDREAMKWDTRVKIPNGVTGLARRMVRSIRCKAGTWYSPTSKAIDNCVRKMVLVVNPIVSNDGAASQ